MGQVRIRELKEKDSPKYFSWINNRDLVLLNSAFSPVSRESHNRWFGSIRKDKSVRVFSIVTNFEGDEDYLIGTCSLRKINDLNKNAELQIRIGEAEFRNKGFGTIVVKKLLGFGFCDLNLHKIYLDVFRQNERARRVYLNSGFTEEGILREQAFIDGKFVDISRMSILAREFLRIKKLC